MIALDHPHIVKVIEFFVATESFYLVMELCTGPDLFSYIIDHIERQDGSGCIPEKDVAVILRQSLKSVLCCHAHGFVHRDLNAKNFMFTGSDMTLKLIDFGLAIRFRALTPPGQGSELVGTLHYMAPEMMLNGQYGPAADLWSL